MGAMCVDIQLAKMKEIWRDTREVHKIALDLESAFLSELVSVSERNYLISQAFLTDLYTWIPHLNRGLWWILWGKVDPDRGGVLGLTGHSDLSSTSQTFVYFPILSMFFVIWKIHEDSDMQWYANISLAVLVNSSISLAEFWDPQKLWSKIRKCFSLPAPTLFPTVSAPVTGSFSKRSFYTSWCNCRRDSEGLLQHCNFFHAFCDSRAQHHYSCKRKSFFEAWNSLSTSWEGEPANQRTGEAAN